MQTALVALLQYVLSLQFFQGYRTILGAIGLVCAGLGKIFADPQDIAGGVSLIAGAIGLLGVRHQDQQPADLKYRFKLWFNE